MDRFGKYEVVEQIGVGGFGEVFKGFDPDIRRYLAIKTCTSNDEVIRGRFRQEAKIAGNLHHTNITTIYDFGVQDGVPYLAQELLTGQDLDRMMTGEEPIALGDKLSYLRQVATGLEFAHSRGVVHRDVKPSNIHVLKNGTVKILDFGIARLMHEDIGLTKTGTTVGTAAYLAPEQVRGGKVDQRTDIFSFGVLAYELLTDVKPFQGSTFSSVIYKILSEEPEALRELAPDCPREVAAVIGRCMEKEPDDRYNGCDEILAALPEHDLGEAAELPAAEESLGQLEVERPQPPVDRRASSSPVWGWGIGITVVAAAALAGFLYLQRGGEVATAPEPAPEAPTEGAEGEQPPVEPAAADVPTEGEGPPGGEPAAPVEEPPEEALEAATETQPEPEPVPEPSPPPPPAKAALTVAQAWSDDMTVSLDGGTATPLLHDWTWEVDAGTHELLYRINTADYSTFARQTIELVPDETKTVSSPILRPGRLSVQPILGTPQGLVMVGDDQTGHSPLAAQLTPGRYQIVIEALSGGYDSITLDVEIASEQWSVVTFDLTRAAETRVETRSAPESGGE